jgi:hypothetical protein
MKKLAETASCADCIHPWIGVACLEIVLPTGVCIRAGTIGNQFQ